MADLFFRHRVPGTGNFPGLFHAVVPGLVPGMPPKVVDRDNTALSDGPGKPGNPASDEGKGICIPGSASLTLFHEQPPAGATFETSCGGDRRNPCFSRSHMARPPLSAGFWKSSPKLEKIANVTQDPISDRTPVCKRLPEHPRNEDSTKTGLQNLPGDHRAVRTLARIRPGSRFFGRSILSSAPSRDVLSPAPAFVLAGSGPRRTAFL